MPIHKPITGKGNRIITDDKNQIRLTLGLVMSPGFPEVQGCPMTEQYQKSITLGPGWFGSVD